MSMEQQSRQKRVVKDPVRYKTVMCNKFETLGKCPYGPRCQFAHGASELRERPALKPATNCLPCDDAQERPSTSSADVTPDNSPRITAAVPKLEVPAFAEPPARRRASSTLAPYKESLSERSEEEGQCEPVDAGRHTSFDHSQLEIDALTGQVMCKRNASQTTLNVRRTISFMLDDGSSDMGAMVDVGNPFGSDFVSSGPLDLSPGPFAGFAIASPAA